MINVKNQKLKDGEGMYKYSIIEILQSNFVIYGLIFDKNEILFDFLLLLSEITNIF